MCSKGHEELLIRICFSHFDNLPILFFALIDTLDIDVEIYCGSSFPLPKTHQSNGTKRVEVKLWTLDMQKAISSVTQLIAFYAFKVNRASS